MELDTSCVVVIRYVIYYFSVVLLNAGLSQTRRTSAQTFINNLFPTRSAVVINNI